MGTSSDARCVWIFEYLRLRAPDHDRSTAPAHLPSNLAPTGTHNQFGPRNYGSAEYRTRPHDGFCAADGPEHELAHDDYCDYGDVRHGCRDHQR